MIAEKFETREFKTGDKVRVIDATHLLEPIKAGDVLTVKNVVHLWGKTFIHTEEFPEFPLMPWRLENVLTEGLAKHNEMVGKWLEQDAE